MALNENTARLAFLDANWKINDTTIEEIMKAGNVNHQVPSKSIYKNIPKSLEGYSALHIVMEHEDTNSIQKLLKNGADVTSKDIKGITALHRAFECKRCSIGAPIFKFRGSLKDSAIDLLLSAQVESNVTENPRSKNEISHLHTACITNNVEAVEFFLKNGASANETVHFNSPIHPGYSPLHFAARYSSAEVASILLDHGAEPHAKDAQDLTPLHMLIKRNMEISDWLNTCERGRYGLILQEYNSNEMIIKAILEKTGEEIIDDTGLSRLHVACALKDISVLETMLEESMELDHSVKTTSKLWPGYTALHFAAHCNVEAFKLLMNRGNSFLPRAINRFTALDLCLQRYNVRIVHDVIESQPDWKNIRFSDDQTKLLDFIYSMRSKKAFQKFVNSNIKDIDIFIPHDSPIFTGYTPLHIVTVAHERNGCIDDFTKDTLYAARNDYLNLENCKNESVSCLERINICLVKNPDLTAEDYHESTALHLAFKLRRPHLVKAIQMKISESCTRKKLYENCINEDGLSHFQIACASGNKELADILISKNKKYCLENSSLMKDYEYVRDFDNFPVVFKIASTPLHIAVVTRNFKMIEYSLHCGCDVHAQDSEGMTAIHRAIAIPEICNFLFKWDTKNLQNRVADCGLSHLHVACAMKNIDAAAVLIRNGADINATVLMDYEDDETLRGLSPLQIAVKVRSREIVKMLLRAGAKIIVEPHYFFDQRYEDCIDLFDRYVAKGKPVDEIENLTELHVACYVIDVDRVKNLLNEGADPNARIHATHSVWSNYTPLHLLASVHRYDKDTIDAVNSIVKMLMDHGADVKLTTDDNETPLHKAFYENCQASSDGKTFDASVCNTSKEIPIPKRLSALLKMQPVDLETQLLHGWNENDRTQNIYLMDDQLTIHRFPDKLNTDGIRGKVGYTKGLHVWEIHCSARQIGTHVGIATAEAPLYAENSINSVIGTNESSWGLDIATKRLVYFHDNCEHRRHYYSPICNYGNTVASSDKITVILDMDEGTLAYMINDVYLGVAFKGLKGKTIYPAVSLVQGRAEVTMKYIGGIENDDRFGATLDVILSRHSDYNMNLTDNKGISIFHIACMCNNVSVVKKFLEHGVNVNQPIDHFCGIYAGCTPLHLAVYHKHTEIIDLLIKHGADIHARNREGNTPLHCAANFSDHLLGKQCDQQLIEDVLVKLISAGADVQSKNRFDQMPIEIFTETIYANISNYCDKSFISTALTTLLGNQIKVNIFNCFDVGFIATAISGDLSMENILENPVYAAVINHAEVNRFDDMGRNPIHNMVSIYNNPCKIRSNIYLKAIEELIKLNFNIDHYDYEGRTPLHYAVKFQNLEAINVLLDLGANFNIIDIDGETPYSLAFKLKKEKNDVQSKIFEIFATQVCKLKIFGLDISEVNEEVYENVKSEYRGFYDMASVKTLEDVKIGTCEFSLHEFISGDNAMVLYENMDKEARKNFDELFQPGNKQLMKEYPRLAGILRLQYRKVRAKMTLPTDTESTSILSYMYSYLPWAY